MLRFLRKASSATARAVEDRLNFSRLVVPLVAQIAGRKVSDPPLTVGVFGQWGTGKTRFLRLIEEQLKEKKITSVWFNAWRYGNEEHVWVALLQRVIDQLKASGHVFRRAAVHLRLAMLQGDLRGGMKHLLARLGLFLLRLVVLVAVIMGAIAFSERVIPGAKEGVDASENLIRWLTVAAAFFIANPKELFGVLRGVSTGIDLSRYVEGVAYRDRVTFLDQLIPFFRGVVRVAGGGRPVVVLIDDLDRCLPDKAVQILEAIALFLEVEGCVFVLAVDRQMVEDAISVKYKELTQAGQAGRRPIGEGYFDKIVQLPIGIPPMANDQFKDFLETLAPNDELRRCVPILMESLPRNARKCERFMATLSFMLASRKGAGNIVTSLLVKLLTLQELLPTLTDSLRQQPKLLEIAELHYTGSLQPDQVDASVLALLDQIAAATPAFRMILAHHLDGSDSFKGVDLGPYIYVLDPVIPAAPAAVSAVEKTEEAAAKVPASLVRQYSDVFLRRHEMTTLPFGPTAAFSVSDLPSQPLLDAASGKVDVRSLSQIVAAIGHVALLGEAGSGKSILLRQLGVEAARNGERLPALIRFRDLSLGNGTAAEFLRALEAHFHGSETALDADSVRGLLESGRLLLLLDGLDEIEDELRSRAREALLAVVSRYPRTNVVLASRTASYQSVGGRFREYTIGRLADSAWQGMATALLHAVGAKPEEFVHQVQKQPALRELARNPLLLAMLVSLFHATGYLERNRTRLVNRAAEVFFERWDMMRGVSSPVPAEQVRVLLRILAAEMIRSGSTTFSLQQVDDVRKELVRRTRSSDDVKIVLRTAIERTGLVMESSAGVYAFTNRIFLEYFAAEEIVQGPNVREELMKLAGQHAYGVVHDALLLIASDEDALDVAGRLVDAGLEAIDVAAAVAVERFNRLAREALRGRIISRAAQLKGKEAELAMAAAQRLGSGGG
jgi:hypothetical protein